MYGCLYIYIYDWFIGLAISKPTLGQLPMEAGEPQAKLEVKMAASGQASITVARPWKRATSNCVLVPVCRPASASERIRPPPRLRSIVRCI